MMASKKAPHATLALPTGETIPRLGLGTWRMGEDRRRREAEVAALRLGLDLGLGLIDTAEMYGSGGAEAVVAEAIAGRRDEVFLVSKVLPDNASRQGTIAACERSLARLGTDRLDCYLLHWRGRHPLEDTIAAFEKLVGDGKILSWGVSNFDADDLDEAYTVAASFGETITCDQVLYHLKERAIEHAVMPWCEKHKVAIVAYSPLGHGTFPGPRSAGGRVLKEIAELHHATPRQVALQFLVHRPGLFAIPKASTPEHATENAGAGDFQLSDVDVERIDKAFPRSSHYRGLPVL